MSLRWSAHIKIASHDFENDNSNLLRKRERKKKRPTMLSTYTGLACFEICYSIARIASFKKLSHCAIAIGLSRVSKTKTSVRENDVDWVTNNHMTFITTHIKFQIRRKKNMYSRTDEYYDRGSIL